MAVLPSRVMGVCSSMELTCRETQGIFVNMPNVFFFALKRVKTYMRETMGGERLSDLLVICTETACAKNINFEILVDKFG